MQKIMVKFNDGSQKEFNGLSLNDLQEIAEYCKEHNLVTEGFENIPDETVYTSLTHEPLPEPVKCEKSIISISATVHEEQGEWIDWWIDCDDADISLPYDADQCEKYLRKYDIILVGDKWFSGKDARKAMNECYRQYKMITILDDKDKVVAEIYDRQVMYDCTEDLGRYRWMSQKFGNVERTFADVLECAEDGDVFKHSYKGW